MLMASWQNHPRLSRTECIVPALLHACDLCDSREAYFEEMTAGKSGRFVLVFEHFSVEKSNLHSLHSVPQETMAIGSVLQRPAILEEY